MEEEPFQKIAISGPTLTSIIQRFSSSSGDVDGLLYGHITSSSPILQDDVVESSSSSSTRSSSDSSTTSIATITGFFCSGTVLSFYNSLGQLNLPVLQSLADSHSNQKQTLIGWFVGRRRTSLRPSMREFSVCKSLNTKNALVKSSNLLLPVFMIFGTPAVDQTIHTHDYQAFQFRRGKFEAKTVDVVNIGPAFRGHYNDFAPNSMFPLLPCVFKGDVMEVGENERSKGSLSELKEKEKGQRKLDKCVQGFEVGRLSRLMGEQAMGYTKELEALYEAMLMKLEGLVRVVEKSNEKVFEQENRIGKMRKKFAGLE